MVFFMIFWVVCWVWGMEEGWGIKRFLLRLGVETFGCEGGTMEEVFGSKRGAKVGRRCRFFRTRVERR